MKNIFFFLIWLLLSSCSCDKEGTHINGDVYVASTPADPGVRIFLGIPLVDSVDFIRWKIIFQENQYTLQCRYGIGKPNTRDFYDGGKKIEIKGGWNKEGNVFQLNNAGKTLQLAELNKDLLHILNADNSMMIGNGGWSYTLNNVNPSVTDVINMKPGMPVLKDSAVFEGRSPCGVPGNFSGGGACSRLKWTIILYADAGRNQPTTYKVLTATWLQDGGKKGNWKIVTGNDGRIIYTLVDANGNIFLNLLRPGENILLFIDAKGKLLVGNEDFSYTVSRVQ